MAVRLAGGPHRCAGRVEVLQQQQWGTVCHRGWDRNDAEVVCRQLGCGTARSVLGWSSFGQGHGPIWLSDVTCNGTESALSQCRAGPRGVHSCHHGEDAGLVCSEPPEVRLLNGSSPCSGRVELLHNQQWGTVCDHGWDLSDAEVVCQQLGCGEAISAPGLAYFGPGPHQIWLSDVECTGSEENLFECPSRMEEAISCHHGEDAGVVCSGSLTPPQPLPLLPVLLTVILAALALICGALLYKTKRRQQ